MEVAENQTNDTQKYLNETKRVATFLWGGLLLAMTLFYVQSQIIFIKSKPTASAPFEWSLVFLGIVTFLFGFFFYRNYTRVRKKALLKASLRDRKQTLLIAFVYQFVLFETLGLYGVLLSVMTQNPLKAVPFIAFAYFGFAMSFPKLDKIKPFFL